MSWCSRNVGSSIVSDLSLPRVNPFALEHVCYMVFVFRFLTLSLFFYCFLLRCPLFLSFAITAPLSPSGATFPCFTPLVMFSSFMVQTTEAQKRYRRERALSTCLEAEAEARKAREREKNRESQRRRRARIAALANASPLSPTCELSDEPMKRR